MSADQRPSISVLERARLRATLASKSTGLSADRITELLRRSLRTCEQLLGMRSYCVAESRYHYADFLITEKRWQEAASELAAALMRARDVLGPNHPRFGVMLREYATILSLYYERYDEALEAVGVADRVLREHFGPESSEVAQVLMSRGAALWGLGRTHESERAFVESAALYEKQYGPDHRYVATALENWALVKLALGEKNDSERLRARAAWIRERFSAAESRP